MFARSEVIKLIMNKVAKDDLVISTTGMISREIFSFRDRKNNFYMIGSMGLANSLAIGVAVSNPSKNVIVFDGDGSFLMNMGSVACAGYYRPKNLTHIVLDNYGYQSTGNQPSISDQIDICGVATASGYESVFDIENFKEEDIESIIISKEKLSLYRIHVGSEETHGIPRVSHNPEEITNRFKVSIIGTES